MPWETKQKLRASDMARIETSIQNIELLPRDVEFGSNAPENTLWEWKYKVKQQLKAIIGKASWHLPPSLSLETAKDFMLPDLYGSLNHFRRLPKITLLNTYTGTGNATQLYTDVIFYNGKYYFTGYLSTYPDILIFDPVANTWTQVSANQQGQRIFVDPYDSNYLLLTKRNGVVYRVNPAQGWGTGTTYTPSGNTGFVTEKYGTVKVGRYIYMVPYNRRQVSSYYYPDCLVFDCQSKTFTWVRPSGAPTLSSQQVCAYSAFVDMYGNVWYKDSYYTTTVYVYKVSGTSGTLYTRTNWSSTKYYYVIGLPSGCVSIAYNSTKAGLLLPIGNSLVLLAQPNSSLSTAQNVMNICGMVFADGMFYNWRCFEGEPRVTAISCPVQLNSSNILAVRQESASIFYAIYKSSSTVTLYVFKVEGGGW